MEENFRILKPFLRGLPIVVIVMVISVMVAKKYLGYVTPMYESTAKIKLADIGEGIPNSNLFKNLDVFASANKIMAEIEVLKSSDLIGKALKQLDFNTEIYRVGAVQSVELYNNSPISLSVTNSFPSVYDTRFKLGMTSAFDFEVRNEDGKLLTKGKLDLPVDLLGSRLIISINQKVMAEKKNIQLIGDYEFEFLSHAKLLEKINKNIDIVAVDKDVPVIRINLKSNVPDKAAAFVNKLAQVYIYDYIETKYQAANTTVKFLNQQIEAASSKLVQSENHIEDYRDANKIVNIRQETETDLRKISQMKIQQTNLKMNLQAIDELNKYITAGKNNFLALAPNFEAFTDLLSTEIVKNIKKLQADKRDLQLTFTPNDERVKVVDAKIADLTNYLVESIKNTRANLQIKYDQMSSDILAAEATFVTVPEKEKNMNSMNRDFNLLQSNYNFLNEKRIEAEIAQAAKISFHRIISPAIVAKKPISPNRSIIIILGALLGLIGSIVAIYSIHFMKAKVNDVYSIEQNSSIPIAVCTPFVTSDTEKQFDKNVLQLMLKNILTKEAILTVTSRADGEGKRFNLLHLCRSIASQHQTVLLIDAGGELEFLKTTSHDIPHLFNTSIENVLYVNLRDPMFAHYSNDRMKELLDDLKRCANYTIINNEFLNEERRALLFMSLADHNLLVIDSRKTPLKWIGKLELIKAEFNMPHLFFLLNKAGYNPSVIKEARIWIKNKLSQPLKK